LLGRIESRQQLASLDVRADVNKSSDRSSADPKRPVGTDAGPNFPGESDRRLPVLRLNNRGGHQSSGFGGRRFVIAASREDGREAGERKAAPSFGMGLMVLMGLKEH
jgi:hypothetical protein